MGARLFDAQVCCSSAICNCKDVRCTVMINVKSWEQLLQASFLPFLSRWQLAPHFFFLSFFLLFSSWTFPRTRLKSRGWSIVSYAFIALKRRIRFFIVAVKYFIPSLIFYFAIQRISRCIEYFMESFFFLIIHRLR